MVCASSGTLTTPDLVRLTWTRAGAVPQKAKTVTENARVMRTTTNVTVRTLTGCHTPAICVSRARYRQAPTPARREVACAASPRLTGQMVPAVNTPCIYD